MALTGVDILSIVAGVIQIADVGARLTVKLSSFARKVNFADSAIRDVSQDVALTCSVLRELGNELQKDEEAKLCSDQALTTTQNVINECAKVFRDLEWHLSNGAPKDTNHCKRWLQKIKYPFIEPHVELLRSNLERLKSTLLLMLNVIMYAGQLRAKASSYKDMKDQRDLIKLLNNEIEDNKKKVESLSKRIESTSLLGSVDSVATRYLAPDASVDIPTLDLHVAGMIRPGTLIGAQLGEAAVSREDSFEELNNYCELISALLSEIDAVKYKIQMDARDCIRQGVIQAHHTQIKKYEKLLHTQAVSAATDCVNDLIDPPFESSPSRVSRHEPATWKAASLSALVVPQDTQSGGSEGPDGSPCKPSSPQPSTERTFKILPLAETYAKASRASVDPEKEPPWQPELEEGERKWSAHKENGPTAEEPRQTFGGRKLSAANSCDEVEAGPMKACAAFFSESEGHPMGNIESQSYPRPEMPPDHFSIDDTKSADLLPSHPEASQVSYAMLAPTEGKLAYYLSKRQEWDLQYDERLRGKRSRSPESSTDMPIWADVHLKKRRRARPPTKEERCVYELLQQWTALNEEELDRWDLSYL